MPIVQAEIKALDLRNDVLLARSKLPLPAILNSRHALIVLFKSAVETLAPGHATSTYLVPEDLVLVEHKTVRVVVFVRLLVLLIRKTVELHLLAPECTRLLAQITLLAQRLTTEKGQTAERQLPCSFGSACG